MKSWLIYSPAVFRTMNFCQQIFNFLDKLTPPPYWLLLSAAHRVDAVVKHMNIRHFEIWCGKRDFSVSSIWFYANHIYKTDDTEFRFPFWLQCLCNASFLHVLQFVYLTLTSMSNTRNSLHNVTIVTQTCESIIKIIRYQFYSCLYSWPVI